MLKTLCGRGGIGRRARLRSVWLRPCEFKPRRPHLMYSGLTAMKKKSIAVVIISNGPGELTTWVNPVVDELNKIFLVIRGHFLQYNLERYICINICFMQ